MSISIQPDLEAPLRARAEAEGITVEGYVERIARDDERAEAESESVAFQGLDSGETIHVEAAYWDLKRGRLRSGG